MTFKMSFRIKYLFVFFISILILFLSLKKEKAVEIYAINMMYACGDCSIYKIFAVEDGHFLYKKNQLNSHGIDKDFMKNAEKFRAEESTKDNNTLLGTEFYVTFSGKEERSRFENTEGEMLYPSCYVFYFKGVLTNEFNWFSDKKNSLKVNSYKIIPEKNCLYINNKTKTLL